MTQQMKVMIVEDNAVMREKIADLLLRIEGVDTVVQLSGSAKLADYMKGDPPRIILMDAGVAYREQDNLAFLKHSDKKTRIIALAEDDRELFVLTGVVEKIRVDDVIMKKDVYGEVRGLVRKMAARDKEAAKNETVFTAVS